MGYWYSPRHNLSRQQIEIVRWVARRRLQSGMLLSNPLRQSPVEAEGLEITERRGVHTNVQDMEKYGPGNWSGHAQLWIGGQREMKLDTYRSVAEAGRYGLGVYLTMAPDFGRVQFGLDGEQPGHPDRSLCAGDRQWSGRPDDRGTSRPADTIESESRAKALSRGEMPWASVLQIHGEGRVKTVPNR